VERSIDFNGKTIEYDRDELNRILTKRFVDEGRSVSYDYTPAGRIKTVTDERGLTSFNYNERGLLDSRTEPDGTSIFYTYNPANLVESVTSLSGTIEYRYDELNRLDTVIGFNPNEVTTYQYDSAGNLETVVLPNGITETRGYDKMNRLTSLVNQDEQGNIVSSYVYTLDKAGHKKTVEESDGRKVEYTYDELYRLTKEEITDPVQGNRTIDYAYDAVGNRLTRDDSVAGETTYVYDNNDRLLSETTAGVTTDYSYDKNGNTTRVAVVGSSAETIYEWDGENRLRNATAIDALGGTNSSQFWYDVNGLRVASVVNGEETRYLLDTSRPHAEAIEEYAPDGEIKTSYVHGLDLISRQSDENSLYYLQDGHSGVRQLSNGLGEVTDFYNYDAYGRLLHSVGGSENNYLYRGEQFDPNVGLQYLRSRYYNPDNGRFASVDPFEGLLAEPMSRHRYLYGNANPVTYLDPSGEFSIAEVMQTSVINDILLLLGNIGLGQRVAGLLSGGDNEIEWNGILSGGTASITPAYSYVAGVLTANLTSKDNGYGPNGLGRLQGIWAIFVGGAALGPVPISVSGSSLELKSPRLLGVSLGALSGGFLAGGASYGSIGFGGSASFITMGFGYGYGVGGFLGFDLGLTALTGIAVPIYRKWLPPLPLLE
jgi:RHS repeat-associated protein